MMVKLKFQSESGLGLVETLVAVAVLGTSVVAFVASLAAGALAVRAQDGISTPQSLAQTQLEYVKSCAFDPGAITYPAVAAPPGYSLSVAVSGVAGADADMQKITVTVTRDGEDAVVLQGYKVNR